MQKLRSAFLSLKRNLPFLWTWYDFYEFGIPNTNNVLEGQFSDLKTKLRNLGRLVKKSPQNLYHRLFPKDLSSFLSIKPKNSSLEIADSRIPMKIKNNNEQFLLLFHQGKNKIIKQL